uniref:Uncharacterized protein n=1 Tax=Anguilla anguilla TaxID=7936 RepID=A0A0E9QBU6_ANGAN
MSALIHICFARRRDSAFGDRKPNVHNVLCNIVMERYRIGNEKMKYTGKMDRNAMYQATLRTEFGANGYKSVIKSTWDGRRC